MTLCILFIYIVRKAVSSRKEEEAREVEGVDNSRWLKRDEGIQDVKDPFSKDLWLNKKVKGV